jgi:hypothetical protein
MAKVEKSVGSGAKVKRSLNQVATSCMVMLLETSVPVKHIYENKSLSVSLKASCYAVFGERNVSVESLPHMLQAVLRHVFSLLVIFSGRWRWFIYLFEHSTVHLHLYGHARLIGAVGWTFCCVRLSRLFTVRLRSIFGISFRINDSIFRIL